MQTVAGSHYTAILTGTIFNVFTLYVQTLAYFSIF